MIGYQWLPGSPGSPDPGSTAVASHCFPAGVSTSLVFAAAIDTVQPWVAHVPAMAGIEEPRAESRAPYSP